MEYKALISFTGLVSMDKGEVREISDPSIVQGLLDAGYIEANVIKKKAIKKKGGKKK